MDIDTLIERTLTIYMIYPGRSRDEYNTAHRLDLHKTGSNLYAATLNLGAPGSVVDQP